MLQDLRYALRTVVMRPLFAGVVVLTLGAAIGANSAVFAVVNAALFTPAPVRAPDELLNVYTADSSRRSLGALSYPDYVDVRASATAFTDVFGYSGLMTTVTGGGEPEVLFGEIVTGNYFAVTGARLALGRGFLPDEDRTPGTHPVVVLSHRLWQRRFAGDSNVLGRSLTLNGRAFTIVGVASSDFPGLLVRGISADVWAPVMMMGQLRTNQLASRGERWMFVKGRLRPGATEAGARDALRALGARLATAYPATNAGRSFAARPTTDVMVNPDADRVLFPGAMALLVTVGFVLLIACTNLANMVLARTSERRREIAVRLAIGASRARLIRQLLAENAVLAVLGGVAGVLIAGWLARLLVAFRPPLPVPIALNISIDARVIGYSTLLAAAACLLLGLAPALQASRSNIAGSLSNAAAPLDRRSRWLRLRNAFLVPQLALSMALLVVAGLFTRSVARAGAVDAGFDVAGTAMIALNLALDGYDEPRARAFYEALGRRAAALPGVRAVTVTDRVPLDLYGNRTTTISVEPASASVEPMPTQLARVDSRYFDALGIAIVQGRAFTEDEVRVAARVAIVSAAAARLYWPGKNPIGQQLREGAGNELVDVVGVARDVKVQTLGESPQPFVYRPAEGGHTGVLRVVARSSADATTLLTLLRREASSLDPNLAILDGRAMAEYVNVMLFPYRAAAWVGSALGLFGLLLAAVGLYGVVAFGVARRTREFGIRMALGARAEDIVRMVFAENGRVVAIGLGAGLALALGLAQVLSGVLFGITATDPLTFVGITATLIAVSAVATWIPARRATSVPPSAALREE